MREFLSIFKELSGFFGIIEGLILIISVIIKLIGYEPKSKSVQNDLIGKSLSILSIVTSIIIIFYYYNKIQPDLIKDKTERLLSYLVFGGFVDVLLLLIFSGSLFLLLFYIYKLLNGNGEWVDYFYLKENNTYIGIVRFIFNPAIVFLSILCNYVTSKMIFSFGFGYIQWLIGPFLPIIFIGIFFIIYQIIHVLSLAIE